MSMVEIFDYLPATPITRCGFCGVEIHWMHTESGAKLPIEARAVEYWHTTIDKGSLVVVLSDGETVHYPKGAREKNMLEWVYVVHIQTCDDPQWKPKQFNRYERYNSIEFADLKAAKVEANRGAFCERDYRHAGPFHLHELRYLSMDEMTLADVQILCERCHEAEHYGVFVDER